MTSYRLPASLGSAIVSGRDGDDATVVVVIDGTEIQLPASMVVKVTPLEPGPGARIEIQAATEQWLVFRRTPAGWYCHDTGNTVSWDEVYVLGDPVHLQPEKIRKGLWGKCTVCGEQKPLRTDGKVRNHGARHIGNSCKGSGRPPAVTE